MFEHKKRAFLGLDIGESAIKLLEIYKARDGYRLRRGRLLELDIDPLFDDSAKKNTVIKDGIKKLLAEEKINSGKVALAISGQSAFVRPLKIPKIAKNKVEQIVKYEAQLQVPFPINEVIWSYELFDTHDSPEMEVTLVAVKKDIVEDRLKLLSGTGLEAIFIETDSFSLYNFMRFLDDVPQDKIVLDIGSRITNIIVSGENKLWTRSVLVGGNDLTKAIATELKTSFKEAERIKRSEGLIALTEAEKQVSSSAAISGAISPVLVELLADVSKTIGYYKSQFGETKMFKEILITGGTSKLKNITQFVRENIDIPTKAVDLMQKIKSDLDFSLEKNLTGRMDVAAGLALRTVMPLSTRANLLPPEMLRAREFEKKKWYIFGSLLAAIFIFVNLTGFVNFLNKKNSDALAKASALIRRYTKFHTEMEGLEKDIRELTGRLDVIYDVSEGRRRSILLLGELMKLLPDNLWLTNIRQDEKLLVLEGMTRGTFENVNTFKSILVKSGRFAGVEVESANVLRDKGTTKDIRAFTIEIKLKPRPDSGSDGDAKNI